MSVRVVLVDDQPMMVDAIRMSLEADPAIEVVGRAGDGEAAVAEVARTAPDVVVMDVRMPGVDGIEATRRIVARDPSVRVLVLTTFDLDEYVWAGLRAGASGFLLKDVPGDQLAAAVLAVARGEAVIAPSSTRRLIDAFVPALPSAPNPGTEHPALAPLTPRERDVLLELARGRSNAEIAAALHLAEPTVKTHVQHVLNKLGCRDRVQAVILAYETGLVR